jgi:hypothetical protein
MCCILCNRIGVQVLADVPTDEGSQVKMIATVSFDASEHAAYMTSSRQEQLCEAHAL